MQSPFCHPAIARGYKPHKRLTSRLRLFFENNKQTQDKEQTQEWEGEAEVALLFQKGGRHFHKKVKEG